MSPDPGFDGVRALARRRAPGLAPRLRLIPVADTDTGTEQVTVEASGGVLTLEASTPAAAAVGLARCLEEFFDADLSWDAPDVACDGPIPDTPPQRLTTPLRSRYHLNPVAFGYSAAFWDWQRWERHIDWMALHGVTMPLNLVGHEAVLVGMLRDLGADPAEAAAFVGGTAFLPWTTMGVTHDVGAPLSEDVLASRARLGRRIVERERDLGMHVVLPGFGGQLPASLAGDELTITWQGWRTSLVAPEDPLFTRAAAALHRHQRELLGSDHLVAVDPFIESVPPTTAPEGLAAYARAIYAAMHAADPEAVWVLQGWPFHYQAGFWTAPRVRALLSGVPEDRLLLLDLWAECAPMWQGTENMYGRRWLWCLAHDFGGRFGLFGDLGSLEEDLRDLREAAVAGTRGRLEGFGITAESIDENPVVYELALRALWSPMPSGEQWRRDYRARRWGVDSPAVQRAGDTLDATLYGRGRSRSTPSPLIARPWSRDLPFASQRLAGEALPTADGPPSANLDAENDAAMLAALPALSVAARDLVAALADPAHHDALAHDTVQLAIHVAAQSARAPLRAMVAAADAGDPARIAAEAETLDQLIRAVDRAAATRPELLVGTWIAAARAQAGADATLADALERDARSLISVWGEQSSGLHDYSARHWSGSLADLHAARWRAWSSWLQATAGTDRAAVDPAPLRDRIRRIEEDWRASTDPYPVTPHGDTAAAVTALLDLADRQLPRLSPAARSGSTPSPAATQGP